MFIFDLETQHLTYEVGGWANIEALRLAVACSWDEDTGYSTWWESQAGDLIAELDRADTIVGYNINYFDYRVLSIYGSFDISEWQDKSFDLLDEIRKQGYKIPSLEQLAIINLNESKLHGGVDAVRLWKMGQTEELERKCRQDVDLTKRLMELWEAAGILVLPSGDYATWPGYIPAGGDDDE